MRLCEGGLSYTLLSSKYENVARLMCPGRQIIFYMTGSSEFCGIACVSAEIQKKRTVWPNGVYAYRVPLRPVRQLLPKHGLRVKGMLTERDFVTSKEQWALYFRTTMRVIKPNGFQRLEFALTQQAGEPQPAGI